MPANTDTSRPYCILFVLPASHFYPHHRDTHVCGKNSPGAPVFIGLPAFTTKLCRSISVKLKMEEQGMKAKDLEPIIRSKGHVSSILSGRREITLKMVAKLKVYFQLPAELFLQ